MLKGLHILVANQQQYIFYQSFANTCMSVVHSTFSTIIPLYPSKMLTLGPGLNLSTGYVTRKQT